jgi:hypothetical protein
MLEISMLNSMDGLRNVVLSMTWLCYENWSLYVQPYKCCITVSCVDIVVL